MMQVIGLEPVELTLQIALGVAASIASGFVRLIDRSETKKLLAMARDARRC